MPTQQVFQHIPPPLRNQTQPLLAGCCHSAGMLMLWLGLGLALVGCSDAGVMPPANKPLTASPPPNQLLAVVGGKPVYVKDVQAMLRGLKLGQQAKAGQRFGLFARSVVYEEALLQFALREAITQEPALRKRISPLALAYLHDRYVRPQSEVSIAEARSFFLGNKGLVLGEHVRARHIVLRKPAQCHALKKRIRDEDAFIALAKKHSLNRQTAERGGDLGLLQPSKGVFGFEKRLFSMRPGDMRVFNTAKNCHLVRVIEYLPPSNRAFEEVKPAIQAHVGGLKATRLLQQLIERALKTTQTRWYFTPPKQAKHQPNERRN